MADVAPLQPLENRDSVDVATEMVLVSNEGKDFKVTKSAARLSAMMSGLLDMQGDSEELIAADIEKADTETLGYVAKYLMHYDGQPAAVIEKPITKPLRESINEWDKAFLYTDLVKGGNEKDHGLLIAVLITADYMQIEPLRDLGVCCIADMVKGKTVNQIRDTFHIDPSTFTPEQQAIVDAEAPYLGEDFDGNPLPDQQ